jgi:hypothetical protein
MRQGFDGRHRQPFRARRHEKQADPRPDLVKCCSKAVKANERVRVFELRPERTVAIHMPFHA